MPKRKGRGWLSVVDEQLVDETARDMTECAESMATIWQTTIRVVSVLDVKSNRRVRFVTALPLTECRRFAWTVEETVHPSGVVS